jgi:hypothetical protein
MALGPFVPTPDEAEPLALRAVCQEIDGHLHLAGKVPGLRILGHGSGPAAACCLEVPAVGIFSGVCLLDQEIGDRADQGTSPRLVRAGQAEREVGDSAAKDRLEHAVEHSPTAKPVVPLAEARHTVSLCQLGLPHPRLIDPQVGEAELAGNVGLVMARIQGRPRATFVHSVKPGLCHSSFYATGWNCGREGKRTNSRLDVAPFVTDQTLRFRASVGGE